MALADRSEIPLADRGGKLALTVVFAAPPTVPGTICFRVLVGAWPGQTTLAGLPEAESGWSAWLSPDARHRSLIGRSRLCKRAGNAVLRAAHIGFQQIGCPLHHHRHAHPGGEVAGIAIFPVTGGPDRQRDSARAFRRRQPFEGEPVTSWFITAP